MTTTRVRITFISRERWVERIYGASEAIPRGDYVNVCYRIICEAVCNDIFHNKKTCVCILRKDKRKYSGLDDVGTASASSSHVHPTEQPGLDRTPTAHTPSHAGPSPWEQQTSVPKTKTHASHQETPDGSQLMREQRQTLETLTMWNNSKALGTNLFSVSMNVPFWTLHINGIIQYVAFHVWLLPLCITFSRFIRFVACVSTSFLFMTE